MKKITFYAIIMHAIFTAIYSLYLVMFLTTEDKNLLDLILFLIPSIMYLCATVTLIIGMILTDREY